MAAGSFGASALQEAQYKLAEMYATPGHSQTEDLQGTAETAKALLARQRSRAVERIVGNKCVGAELWFLRPNAADVAEGDAPDNCNVPDGAEAETVKVDIDTTVLARASAVVQDNRCDNHVMFSDEVAIQTAHLMARLRRQLNVSVVIPALTAAAQTNLDTFISGTWDDTNPRIIVPTADFAWDNLNEFRIVAENNGFRDFFFMSGRLFNDDTWLAMLNKMNETERAAALAWANRQIYFDTRDLDQTMTKKTAFAIDSNSYAFWNTYRSTPTVTQIDSANEVYVWVVRDPVLTWNNGGTQMPVWHEMEMQKTCVERDAHEFRRFEYKLYGRTLGGFEIAPTGPNGETGVLEFGEEAI